MKDSYENIKENQREKKIGSNYKNFSLSSGVGILHASLLPNHLYRYFAMILYNMLRIKGGTIMKMYDKFHGKPRFFATLNAAVVLVKYFSPSTRTNDDKLTGSRLNFFIKACPGSDCIAAYLK